MSQSYFSPKSSIAPEVAEMIPETSISSMPDISTANGDIQDAYVQQKDRLVQAIDSTKVILSDLRHFNKESWIIRYPQIKSGLPSAKAVGDESSPRAPNGALRRSLSFVDDPSYQADVVLKSRPTRGTLKRSATLSSVSDSATETEVGSVSSDADTLVEPDLSTDFHVLRLDLKLGPTGSGTSPAALVAQLEKSSIANLVDDRLSASLSHIDKLKTRVEDKTSKVLVTGDLNAGKSTFVNALLHREVMPVDQQPCTTVFCEVHDVSENDGVEEAHWVSDSSIGYDREDESTFSRIPLSDVEALISNTETVGSTPSVLKMYLGDDRKPTDSLLSNGVVSINLIDAPGLNRDSIKTTALFARQEEIDVVVFVVSAENHFTLSAKEFLFNAANEKAYVFIVVNRFDSIRDKQRCKRLVLDQIRQLSPRTYDDAEDLVHFVDSESALARGLLGEESDNTSAEQNSFGHLEEALRSFVLVKRSKSKLLPAATYLQHILSDVDLLASANGIVAQSEADQAQADLARTRPVLEKMQREHEAFEECLEETEDSSVRQVGVTSQAMLDNALERVGRGELGTRASDVTQTSGDKYKVPTMPLYPGLLGVWEYTRAVRLAMLESLDLAVRLAEDEARVTTAKGVEIVYGTGNRFLPEGIERPNRVFMPEAMFIPRLKPNNSKRSVRTTSSNGAVVAGGSQGLGLGLLVSRSDMTLVTFVDIIDIQHHYNQLTKGTILASSDESSEGDDMEGPASVLSTLGLGLGALTMVGGKTIGARGLLEGVLRISDLFGNESSRRWIAPVVGVAAVGLSVYFVLELPSTIPRTVGRRIKTSLASKPPTTVAQELVNHTLSRRNAELVELPFVQSHVARITRETRKVLRISAWDVREKFRAVMDENAREVKSAEEMESRALKALAWFQDIGDRTEDARSLIGLEA